MGADLETYFFDVEIFQKLTIFELIEKARFDDISGFEIFRALVNRRADVHERLKRFAIQLRQWPQLRRKGIVHGIDADGLITGKIFLEDGQACIPFRDKKLDRRCIPLHESPYRYLFSFNKGTGRQ